MSEQVSSRWDADSVLADLAERLGEKAHLLSDMADENESPTERVRLRGKAEGVDLALSFVEQMVRERAHAVTLDHHRRWLARQRGAEAFGENIPSPSAARPSVSGTEGDGS